MVLESRPAHGAARTGFTADEARQVGTRIGSDWATAPFDVAAGTTTVEERHPGAVNAAVPKSRFSMPSSDGQSMRFAFAKRR